MAFVARDAGTSAARRRRERRLRSMLRHERMTVAMALAEMTHHSAPRRPTMARARGKESEANNTTGQMTPPPSSASTVFFNLFDDGGVLAARPTPRGFCGTPRRTLRTSCPSCRSSLCLCRSWGSGCWTFCGRSTRRHVVVHGELKSWWKCRRSLLIPLFSSGLPSRPLTFQFLMVEAIVAYQVYARDRIQQRLWRRTWTFQFLMVVVDGSVMEALQVSPWDRVQQRFKEQITLTLQFLRVVAALEVLKVSSRVLLVLHPRTRLVPWMRLLQFFFALSPKQKKCDVGSALWVGTGCGL